MSYIELEHGYQDLRSATNQPIFYVGDIGAVQSGLASSGSSLYRSSNRSELSDGCVNDDGCLGGGELEGEGKQVLVGICAMAKKSQSKPMKEILTRLEEFEYIKIIVFAEEVILKEPVEDWPIVDCLISFHSKGFPLDKAIQYANLRNPFIINNLPMQYDIQDRIRVYSILEGEGIEIPRYAVLDRDSADPKYHELVESEDHVEVNGVTFNKPFVEKPVSAEDHNIYIYYPTSAGGGSQRLFRKIGSRSSVYSPESRVRKTGSYIYEDFMPTDGTDVKVYTVGPDYAHAEARKSPALDGKVERDSEGKEIRYPVILSNAEKLISRKVCLAFKQTVCGFDLLRANGQSFVCDVNGFSFVKNSNKYYDDCAKILGNMILRELAPTLHIPWSVPFQLDDPPIVPTTFGKMMELRCVVAVIRHGDRTPKQKMKVEVRHPKFFEIFAKYDGYKHGHVKLKRPKQLQEILDTARSLLTEIQHRAAGPELEEKQGKLEQLKSVLEMYGHFSGINRKVQMKYQPRGRPRGSSSDDGNSSNRLGEPSLVLILKWGGELTPAGRIQAEELGRIFRCMYPGGQEEDSEMLPAHGEYAGAQGLGLLRLHSTFRHDLKIYASDEGRVQMTAAAFAKGLLALEGELTPILVQMVKSANTNGLLDNDCDSSKYQNMVKNRLHELFQQDKEFTREDREQINPTNALSINAALDFVKNPVRCCQHVHLLIQKLMDIVRIKKDDPKTKDAILYHGETWELMGRRWGKIEKDFCTKQKRFDISKIPDIYDCIKYDLQHNNHTLQFEQAEELYIYSKYLADIVIPQEYGLTVQEKLTIGQGICTPLLKKIRADLQRNIEEPGEETVNRLNPRYSHGVSSPGRHVRTRLYFTSESHVHSLLTVLRYGGLIDVMNDQQWRRAMEYVSMVSELNYMSQIVVMLYEDPTKDPSSEERFHVELHFSPGVNCCVQKNLPPGPGFRPHSRNESSHNLGESGSYQDNTSQCSTRIEEEDTEFGTLEDDVTILPLERKRNLIVKDASPPLMETDTADSTLDSPATSRAINMMDLDPNIMDEPYDSGFLQSSAPIPISARTVAGHEAARLGSQLAASQRQRREKDLGVICELRARSYDHQRQDKPEKTADKLKYQSLDAVNKEASSRVSRIPKCSEIFHDKRNTSFNLGKPVLLAHSISSPELIPIPIINVLEDSPPTPNPPLITLHNTPLASPGAVPSPLSCDFKSTSAADYIDADSASATVAATSISSLYSDGGALANGSRSLLRLPTVVKKYSRSHSEMALPVIEISGESTPSDRISRNLNDAEGLSSSESMLGTKGLLDARCVGSLFSSAKLRRHSHHRPHSHHRYHLQYNHDHQLLYKQRYLHQHLDQHWQYSSNFSVNQLHRHYRHAHKHSLSSNQLEAVTEALWDKRARSLSPGYCSCYNCNVSKLILQSRDLSPSERSNFRTYFFRSLSHKFSNCSCYTLAQQYESVNSSYASSYCEDATNSSSPESQYYGNPCNFISHNLLHSFKLMNHKRSPTTAPRLAKSNSCPEVFIKFGKNYGIERSNSLDSNSSSSSFLSSFSSQLHLSCSLDCLRTALLHDNNYNCYCKRCCTPIIDAVATTALNQNDFDGRIDNSDCVEDARFWMGLTRQRRRWKRLCSVCQTIVMKRGCEPNEPNQKFVNSSLRYHHPRTCAVNAICNNNFTNHHHHHHNHRPILHKLQQQRSFSSPDTRPSIIQPDPTCTARRHRHSISGQMSYFKLLGYNVSKKLTGSANSLFSTAVISGSSSAPNLKDMVPPHASAVAAIEGFGGVPPIRPLETLHNALSLRQLDAFLEMMTGAPLFRTPASSPPKFPSPIDPGSHQKNLDLDATRYITPTPIHYKGSHDNELSDIRNQVSPTSPNSTGWSSEPPSFLSSEPSSPAPTSAGECSMSMSLVSNDGSQPFSAGPKFSPNPCIDLDYNDFCMNLDQETRESRGSVSYTDYYSSEDGQIRRSANDNCFPIFMKSSCPSGDSGSGNENPEEDEDHTLTLKQSEEQKKQDVQLIFEQKDSQNFVKPSSSYKKIGRFRVESMEISDGDARIKQTSSLGSSVSSEKSKFLSSRPPLDTGHVAGKKSSNLLRSQSVYATKSGTSSGGTSPVTPKQSSLSAAPSVAGNDSESWGRQTTTPAKPGKEQPLLTLASTDASCMTVGFNLPEEKKD